MKGNSMNKGKMVSMTVAAMLICLGLGTANVQADLTDTNQLIAYYDFESDYTDQSGNNYDLGFLAGGELTTTDYKIVGSESMGRVNGNGYYVPLGQMADMTKFMSEQAKQSYTITMWIRPDWTWPFADPSTFWHYSLHIGGGVDGGDYLLGYYTAAGNYRVHFWNGTWDWSNGYVDLPSGTYTDAGWGFLAITFDSGLATVYGADFSDPNVVASSLTTSCAMLPFISHNREEVNHISIGSTGATSAEYAHYRGCIDEVGIFDTALSVAEVYEVFLGGTNGQSLDVIAQNVISNPPAPLPPCEPASLPTDVIGTVVLEGYNGDFVQVPVTVGIDFIQDGNVVATEMHTLGANGQLSLSEIPSGTYDIAIQSVTSLKRVLNDVPVVSSPTDLGTVVLKLGDLTGDGVVDLLDVAIFSGSWLQSND